MILLFYILSWVFAWKTIRNDCLPIIYTGIWPIHEGNSMAVPEARNRAPSFPALAEVYAAAFVPSDRYV
jgi:hypothetical protein